MEHLEIRNIDNRKYLGYFGVICILHGVVIQWPDSYYHKYGLPRISVYKHGKLTFHMSLVQTDHNKYIKYERPSTSHDNQRYLFVWFSCTDSSEHFWSKHLNPYLHVIDVTRRIDEQFTFTKKVDVYSDKNVTECYGEEDYVIKLPDDGTAESLSVPTSIPSSIQEIFDEMLKDRRVERDN